MFAKVTTKPSGALLKFKTREELIEFIDGKKADGYTSNCVYKLDGSVDVNLSKTFAPYLNKISRTYQSA